MCIRDRHESSRFSTYVRIIFDPGCPESLITENIVTLLQLEKSNKQRIAVKGYLDKDPKWLDTWTVKVAIPEANRSMTLQTTPEIATNVRCADRNEFLRHYPHYSHLKFAQEGNHLDPVVLIGGDLVFSFLATEPKITVEQDLHIIPSLFGHIVSGIGNQPSNTMHPYLITTPEALEQLCSLDVLGICDTNTTRAEDETQALCQFYQTISFHDSRYYVGWPWKINPETLQSNYGLALGRLRTLYRTLKQNPTLLEHYNSIFKQQLDMNIIEHVPENEIRMPGYYIPHQAIYRPERSTPLRAVFDASATLKNLKSLNDIIYKGRTLLNRKYEASVR